MFGQREGEPGLALTSHAHMGALGLAAGESALEAEVEADEGEGDGDGLGGGAGVLRGVCVDDVLVDELGAGVGERVEGEFVVEVVRVHGRISS